MEGRVPASKSSTSTWPMAAACQGVGHQMLTVDVLYTGVRGLMQCGIPLWVPSVGYPHELCVGPGVVLPGQQPFDFLDLPPPRGLQHRVTWSKFRGGRVRR
jgi:hypothetical protein